VSDSRIKEFFSEVGSFLEGVGWIMRLRGLFNKFLKKSKKPLWESAFIDGSRTGEVQDKYDTIEKKLRQIRESAHGYINANINSKKKIKESHIRANIFLSRCDQFQDQKSIILKIPNKFHVNMIGTEMEISFRPGEGATGHCFFIGRRMITTDARKYRLDKDKWAMVHKKLKWIISFPIRRHNRSRDVLAVLNIDGIHENVNRKTLEACMNYERITDHVKEIEEEFQNLPLVTVAVIKLRRSHE